MSNAIDQAFSVKARALSLYSRRAEVLASNIANADTPDYKARDIDFRSVMSQVQQGQQGSIEAERTSSRHLGVRGGGVGLAGSDYGSSLKYRIPMQSSLDGNTVNSEVEQARFSENNIKYQASFSFLNGTIKGLMSAIRGE